MTDTPTHESPRPGRKWYGLAVLLLLIGATIFGTAVNRERARLEIQVDSLQRLIVPGGGDVTFDAPGDYVIYYESDGVHEGKPFHTPRPMPIMAPRAYTQDGEAIGGIQKVTKVTVYNIGGRAGHAMWNWPVEAAGTFRLDANYAQELDKPLPLMLAVGKLDTHTNRYDVIGLYGAAGALAFSAVAAVSITLITFLLRTGAHTRREDG